MKPKASTKVLNRNVRSIAVPSGRASSRGTRPILQQVRPGPVFRVFAIGHSFYACPGRSSRREELHASTAHPHSFRLLGNILPLAHGRGYRPASRRGKRRAAPFDSAGRAAGISAIRRIRGPSPPRGARGRHRHAARPAGRRRDFSRFDLILALSTAANWTSLKALAPTVLRRAWRVHGGNARPVGGRARSLFRCGRRV